MKIKKPIHLILLFCLFTCVACEKDKVEKENEVNDWIYRTLEENYLWYDEIPKKSALNISAGAEDFFDSLLSSKDGKVINGKHHYFSYIEKKGETTKAPSEKEPTYGFEFAVYSVTGNNGSATGKYYAQILYVLPGSPAEEAGLKRGDWIFSVNSKEDNITDYSVLDEGGEAEFYLGKYNEDASALLDNGSVTIPAARVMESTPFLKDSVHTIEGKKIGYMLYNRFASGPEGGDNGSYDTQMKALFKKFKQEQVTEFVLDLRYNGGGLITCAQLLASMLAPSHALGQTFGYIKYNDKKQKSNRELKFHSSSDMADYSLNLNRLYVLTGQQTASSSEAVINSLIPYMKRENITLIGAQTIGKTVGSNTYGDTDSYGWLLHPITLRISNKDGDANYENGFSPDIALSELSYGQRLYPLGDPKDLLLGKAIEKITGSTFRSEQAAPVVSGREPAYISLERKGSSLLVPFSQE